MLAQKLAGFCLKCEITKQFIVTKFKINILNCFII